MCDELLGGVPGCVTKCDMGVGGSKLAKNSVTYFMDGPKAGKKLLSADFNKSKTTAHVPYDLC